VISKTIRATVQNSHFNLITANLSRLPFISYSHGQNIHNTLGLTIVRFWDATLIYFWETGAPEALPCENEVYNQRVGHSVFYRTKKREHYFDKLKKLFSSDTHQSMKTSDNDRKVNRNIYPDAVNVLRCV